MKAEHRLGAARKRDSGICGGTRAGGRGFPGVDAPAYAWTAEQQKILASLAKDLKANAGKRRSIPRALSG